MESIYVLLMPCATGLFTSLEVLLAKAEHYLYAEQEGGSMSIKYERYTFLPEAWRRIRAEYMNEELFIMDIEDVSTLVKNKIYIIPNGFERMEEKDDEYN